MRYIDLQIENRTDATYQLLVCVTGRRLKGQWMADSIPQHTYRVYEHDHWITHEPPGGHVRHNVLRRRVYDRRGELADDEYITENHALMMYPPFLAPGDSSDS